MNHKRLLQRHRLAGNWTPDPGVPSRSNHILVGVSIAIWTMSFAIQHKIATATGRVWWRASASTTTLTAPPNKNAIARSFLPPGAYRGPCRRPPCHRRLLQDAGVRRSPAFHGTPLSSPARNYLIGGIVCPSPGLSSSLHGITPRTRTFACFGASNQRAGDHRRGPGDVCGAAQVVDALMGFAGSVVRGSARHTLFPQLT